MHFGAKALTNLAGGAGKIHQHVIGIDLIYRETTRFEPLFYQIEISLTEALMFADLLGAQPVVKIR
jgi:hypothetical protein